MIINKDVSKIFMFCFTGYILPLKFVGTVLFKILSVVYIISSHIITELSIIHPIYLPFSQLLVAGFQTYNHVSFYFCTHTDIYRYSSFDSS